MSWQQVQGHALSVKGSSYGPYPPSVLSAIVAAQMARLPCVSSTQRQQQHPMPAQGHLMAGCRQCLLTPSCAQAGAASPVRDGLFLAPAPQSIIAAIEAAVAG